MKMKRMHGGKREHRFLKNFLIELIMNLIGAHRVDENGFAVDENGNIIED